MLVAALERFTAHRFAGKGRGAKVKSRRCESQTRTPEAKSMSGKRAIVPAAILSFIAALLVGQGAAAADRYDAAVNHPGRSAADIERDPKDQPARLLRLTGIGPGMHVVDVLGGSGYYSELLSYLVGPKGEVLLVNNSGFDSYDPTWKERLAGNRLPNVTHRVVDLSDMQLGAATFDAALLIKVYHDLYWKELTDGPPKTDAKSVLDQIAAALKPGGVLLVVDHSAKAGTGSADADSLHRIDEVYARRDIESHGFKLIAHADFLRDPTDDRTKISYKPPALGKTDRFVYVFRKER
jgi:predicted methyltransferase